MTWPSGGGGEPRGHLDRSAVSSDLKELPVGFSEFRVPAHVVAEGEEKVSLLHVNLRSEGA